MKIKPKKPEVHHNGYMIKSELSGTMFVGLTEPYKDVYFMLTVITAEPLGGRMYMTMLNNGQSVALGEFKDEILFNKVDGTLTID